MSSAGFAGGLIAVGGSGPLGEPGELEQYLPLLGQRVSISALAASKDGRVAVGGNFQGRVDFGGKVLTTQTEGGLGFVAEYDATGSLRWARYAAARAGSVSGLAFAPDGTLLAQGAVGTSFVSGEPIVTYVVKLDAQGADVWDLRLSDEGRWPTKLVVDSRGDAWAAAGEQVPLMTEGRSDEHVLLRRVSASGSLLETQQVAGEGCLDNVLSDLTIDADDHVIVAARCRDSGGARSSYVQRRDSAGATLLEKRFTGVLSFSFADIVASVDSQRRINTGGAFWGSFNIDGSIVEGDPTFGRPQIWLARFDGTGVLDRSEGYSSNQGSVTALASDPRDNLLMLATCDGLQLGNVELSLEPAHGDAAVCIVKLAADGAPAWARAIEGGMEPAAVVADANGHVWIGGTFVERAWVGGKLIPGNDTTGGLLLRLNP